jgi:SAM-dependent methyltransferase
MKVNAWDNVYQSGQVGPIYEPLWQLTSEAANHFHEGLVIDFGCGDGRYSQLLRKKGFDVIGIDLSDKAISIAEKNVEVKDTNRIRYMIDDDIPFSIKDNSISAVVMLNSYHCMDYDKRLQIISSIDRVLVDNGILFMSVLTVDDESFSRNFWTEQNQGYYDDGTGKKYQFFCEDQIRQELNLFSIYSISKLENIVPGIDRKSSLFIISAYKKERILKD